MSELKLGAWIFARGGSKGVPGKNIRPLAGKPLIAYAIETALQIPGIEEVYVSTDSEEIASVAKDHGASVPFIRPCELATDSASERFAWRHAIQWMRDRGIPIDVIVILPTTTPLRTVGDVTACVDLFQEGKADMVMGVTPSDRHPEYNMVYCDEENFIQRIISSSISQPARQMLRQAYNISTAVYVADPRSIMEKETHFEGTVRAAVLPDYCGVDIDSELDFQIAEFLVQKRAESLERE